MERHPNYTCRHFTATYGKQGKRRPEPKPLTAEDLANFLILFDEFDTNRT